MKRSYFICVLTFCLWGSVYVFSKYAMASFSPMTVMFIRNLIAALFIFAVAPKKQFRKIRREHIKYFLLTGLLGYFLANGLVMHSTHLMSSTLSSLINSANPVFIMLFAALLLRERMTFCKGIGTACALTGVVFVIGIDFGHISTAGVLCSIFGVVFGALGSTIVRKVSAYYIPEQITVCYFVISLPFCLIASVIETVREPLPITLSGVGAVLYIGIVTTAIANLLWNKSLAVMDASVCSMFYPLQPMFAALFSVILLGEKITPELVGGGLLIALGVLIGLGLPGYLKQHKKQSHLP